MAEGMLGGIVGGEEQKPEVAQKTLLLGRLQPPNLARDLR
jgi:hypothetical protein